MTSKALTMIAIIICMIIPTLVYAFDSTHVGPISLTGKKYRSYVDLKNCITTDAKYYVVVLGMGGGNVSQECPSTHPVMNKVNHNIVSATSLASGGKVSIICCAMNYEWA
jgi:hypothetical protein